MDTTEKKQNTLQIETKSDDILFARIICTGIPEIGKEKAHSSGLKLTVAYEDLSGKPIDVSRIQQGTDFVAKVTLHNPGIRGNYRELALTQIFPSGWEIRNPRMEGQDAVGSQDTYSDIKDDRMNRYFDLGVRRTKTFRVMLNASYVGKFYLPAAICEAMYDNTVYARNQGQWTEVVPTP